MAQFSHVSKSMLRSSTAALALAAGCLAFSPSHAIVGNDNYTPAQLVDTTPVTGIGQMVIDEQNGFVGLCTATLINPRTVIFASHCVNEGDTTFVPGSAYGAANDGIPIAFFFNANNNASGNSAIAHWLYGVNGNGVYQTRTSEYAYNSNYVVYNTQSTQLGLGGNFLQADIAMAALDTPATNLPTWTLLFSPLTQPTHATIAGYGANGTGTDGSVNGIDFRRRVAENTLSLLGSLDDVDSSLFGSPDGLPQNLYQIDFNDPKYGTAAANQYDFNIFHDAALLKEAITAGGDSGGPLIVDQMFSTQVIAAVLSGGTRYFNSQPSASYGTTSFYQPLYLYWDWIVANNPYKYVSAKAGDGSWTDPSHWVMDLDPNYVTISANGTLVNALPTTPAQGLPDIDGVNTPKFGQVCYLNDCFDIGTNTPITYSGMGSAPDSAISADTSATAPLTDLVKTWFATGGGSPNANPATLPAPTPANGLPGSTNFVPDDNDGDPVAGTPARYYDVTLSADGTTTLANAQIIIDRLTINGAKTGLTVASSGALGVWIDATMYAGNLRVDGMLVSNGDLALMGGVLSGTGIVVAPYTTAILGAIAPGTIGTTGTLSIFGNVVLSSHAGLLIDLGATDNDRLDVYQGTLSLGGTLLLNPVSGFKPKWHQALVVATADVISGSFASVPDPFAGVLYPAVSKLTANGYDSEVVTIEAASFGTVLTNPSNDQRSIGWLLDGDRAGSYTAMAPLYDGIDMLSDGPLGSAFNQLVPDAARSIPQVSLLLADAQTSFMWQYLGAMSPSEDSKVAIQTGALKLAQNFNVGSYEMRGLLANLGSTGQCGAGIVCATDGSSGGGAGAMDLPKGVGAFLSGQRIEGNVNLGGSGGKADVDGYLIVVGADLAIRNTVRLGLSFGFGEADATLRTQPAHTKTSAKQWLAYGMYLDENGYFLDGYAGVGLDAVHTSRQVSLGGTAFQLDGRTSGLTPLFGIQAGKVFTDVMGGTFKPAIGLQYGITHISHYAETGGAPALMFNDYSRENAAVRIGFDSDWAVDVGGIVVKPQVHAFLVGKIDSNDANVTTAFAAAPGMTAQFDIAGDSSVWADIGLKIETAICDNAALAVTFNANPGNAGGTYTSVGGSLRIKF